MKILLVDNYDSFTFNIIECLRQLKIHDVTVLKNDDEKLLHTLAFDKIILSPGPDVPKASGFLLQVIENNFATIPILGICLGHQAIAQFFGANIVQLTHPHHGFQTSLIRLNDDRLFKNCNQPILVGLYHSWVVDKNNFTDKLMITSVDNDGNIMSFRHNNYNCVGVQFHPESFMTKNGLQILKNWILG